MGGRLLDYMAQGAHADRPLAAGMAALIQAGGSSIYFSNDGPPFYFSFYNEDAVDWTELNITALSGLFQDLTDVDWSTPPTDGQVFKWDAGTSKLVPVSLIFNTAEELQDMIGTFFINGTGTTVVYNDGAGSIKIDSTITQYTNENAMDAIAAMIAAGSHTRITIAYNDAGDAISLTGTVTQYTDGMADARIAAASIAALSDVGSLAGIANGDTLLWNAGAAEFRPGAAAGYTDEQARDAIAAMFAAGTHTGFYVTNNDAGDSMSFRARIPILTMKLYPGLPNAADTVNVNSVTYVDFGAASFVLDLDSFLFTDYRLFVVGGSSQAGQTITVQLTYMFTPGTPIHTGGNDVVVSNGFTTYDTGWKSKDDVVTSGVVGYGLALKGSNATVDLAVNSITLLLR